MKSAASGPAGAMISFREGLETLPRKLAAGIGDVRTGMRATRILRGDSGPVVEVGTARIHARQVVLATPPEVTAQLLEEASSGGSAPLAEIPWAAVAVLSLGFRRQDVAHPLGGFGFLAPRKESLRLLGCLFPSEIFPGRSPTDRSPFGLSRSRTDPEALEIDDAKLLQVALGDLRRALGVRGEPSFVRISRWPKAIPQYEVGHGRFVSLARRLEAGSRGSTSPGIFSGGSRCLSASRPARSPLGRF